MSGKHTETVGTGAQLVKASAPVCSRRGEGVEEVRAGQCAGLRVWSADFDPSVLQLLWRVHAICANLPATPLSPSALA